MLCAEQFARPADLQVLLCNLEAVIRGRDHLQPGLGVVGDGIGQQHTKARPAAPADAPTKLMQLRQPEAIGMFDQHHRRVGHVYADLDHRRRHKCVDFTSAKALHRLLALIAIDSSVQRRQPPPLEMPLLQPVEVGMNVLQSAIRFINDGHDHISLLALGEALRDVRIHLVRLRLRHVLGDYRLAAGRQTADR